METSVAVRSVILTQHRPFAYQVESGNTYPFFKFYS